MTMKKALALAFALICVFCFSPGCTASAEMLDSGWETTRGDWSMDGNPQALAAFMKAIEGFDGVDYEPIVCLGSQVVAGTNYCILCHATVVAPDVPSYFALIYVYEDLDGNAAITEISDLDVFETDEYDETEENTAVMPNPFVEVLTLEEAAEMTGFAISVPDAPAEHPDRIIRVLDNTMVEVIFANSANETEDAIDEAYRIRKGIGTDDISGDYCEYTNTQRRIIGDYDVLFKGNGDTWSVATWTKGEYTYAIDAQDAPLSTDVMTDIVGAVR